MTQQHPHVGAQRAAPLHHNRPMRWLIPLLWIAFGLRVQGLHNYTRLHPDEAFFAAFARNAVVRGEWLFPGNLDKTPLALYGQSLTMALAGMRYDGALWQVSLIQGEFAVRLFSLFMGIISVAAVYALGRRVWRSSAAGLLAAALWGMSPYGVIFSPTAFTDMPMIAFALLALVTALDRRPVWAGVAWALAYGCKQQAVLFLPLVLLWIIIPRRGVPWDAPTQTFTRLTRFFLPIVCGLALLALWDSVRPEDAVSTLATANNAPSGWIIAPDDVWPRLLGWADLSQWAFGNAWITALWLGAALWGILRRGIHWRQAINPSPTAVLVWLIGYGVLHWLVPLNMYDRYVLAALPLVAVWVGGIIENRNHRRGDPWVTPTMAVMLLALTVFNGYGQPIGGDQGQHDGIIPLADFLNTREFGAIVYDRWLGWELNYYLGAWTDKRRAYYPTPAAMAQDAALQVPDVAPRYFPVPYSADFSAWQAALINAGFAVCRVYDDGNRFAVFALTNTDTVVQPLCL